MISSEEATRLSHLAHEIHESLGRYGEQLVYIVLIDGAIDSVHANQKSAWAARSNLEHQHKVEIRMEVVQS